MKKVVAILSIAFVTVTQTVVASAQLVSPVNENWKDLPSIIKSFGRWNVPIATLLFVIAMVYGGYIKLANPDSDDKQQLAMQVWKAAIIGFGVIVLAPFLVSTFGALLGVDLFV